MSDLARLHPDDAEAIARRTVELLQEVLPEQAQPRTALLTAREVAALFSATVEWVYDNAERLGGVRIGDGPKPRKRFDPARSELLRRAVDGEAAPTRPRRRGARRRSPANGRTAAGNPLLPLPGRE